jgi:hypothetical protein
MSEMGHELPEGVGVCHPARLEKKIQVGVVQVLM